MINISIRLLVYAIVATSYLYFSELCARSKLKSFELMSQVNESTAFASVLDDQYAAVGGDWRYQLAEFAKGAAEMSVAFGKGVRDVLKQSVLREDSLVMRKCKGPCEKVFGKLSFLNEFLPEDRDPVHAWTVIGFVMVIALSALAVNTNSTVAPLVKSLSKHPTSATIILLPDGRRMAYREQGVSADQARFSMILPHHFLSSRLAGIPGIKDSLLQEFGVRLVMYDLPGFGESDPHPKRNLESSAMDILHLAFAVNIPDKFWVLGHTDGSMHAWAALRYIPDRIAGAIMVAPMINPYEPKLNKGEKGAIWGNWTTKRRILYLLARKFPKLLPYFYRRSFLSGKLDRIETWLSFSPGKKDTALIQDSNFEEFWQRDVEESVRQGNVRPFVEEAVLQVSNWGFSIADLKIQDKLRGKGILGWLKSVYGPSEERLSGFLGPIHIWQGAEDTMVPPAMSDFVYRVLPDVMLHRLPYEGHFTYFYFCDECHRQMLSIVYGNPQGPLPQKLDVIPIKHDEEIEDEVNTSIDIDTGTDRLNFSDLDKNVENEI